MEVDDKVQFNVYVSKATSEAFHKLIAAKHGTYKRGLVSYEAEMALRQYLASYKMANPGSTHTQNQQVQVQAERANPTPAVYTQYQKVEQYILESEAYGGTVPQFIPELHLIQAIKAVRGNDPRTVKKWLRDFIEFGCVKRSGSGQLELM